MSEHNRLYLTAAQHQIEIEKVDIYSLKDVDALVFVFQFFCLKAIV